MHRKQVIRHMQQQHQLFSLRFAMLWMVMCVLWISRNRGRGREKERKSTVLNTHAYGIGWCFVSAAQSSLYHNIQDISRFFLCFAAFCGAEMTCISLFIFLSISLASSLCQRNTSKSALSLYLSCFSASFCCNRKRNHKISVKQCIESVLICCKQYCLHIWFGFVGNFIQNKHEFTIIFCLWNLICWLWIYIFAV